MSDQGLTQEDFRRLLQTPREPAGSGEQSSNASQKTLLARAPRNAGATFAKPESVKRKKFREHKEKPEQEQDDQYRDRAAERRNAEENDITANTLLQQLSQDGQELDQKAIYEQSKYLGGDTEHTHLVKGLDYSLLERVRRQMKGEKEVEEIEEDAEEVLDQALVSKIDGGQTMEVKPQESQQENGEELEGVDIKTPMARRIYEKAVVESSNISPLKNELFFAGRMAFVFELADERGNYRAGFDIPTSVIRSKADLSHRRSKSGTEDLDADAQLVIGKVVQVITNFKNGVSDEGKQDEQPRKKAKRQPSPPKMVVAMDDDDDIFADAGRDYQLEEDEEMAEVKTDQTLPMGNYFQGIAKPEIEEEDQEETEEQRKANITKILAASAAMHDEGEKEKNAENKESKIDSTGIQMDMDSNDYNTFGLGAEALPSSLEELKKSFAYEQDYEDGNDEASSSLIDAGTHRNKKAQLTRWDFDDEEDWQRYKDNLEVLPKSAMQYGVKMSDGRKRNREQRKAPTEKQKLDRDWQQLKSFMDKKRDK
ncbi:RED-like protein N-terminal region-domain-containing protein [Umbelopsis sp. PMI_123]|nr:RED-like protein N-terminal region-domain-containing protein [Umbelopsis sp. PMI_123]